MDINQAVETIKRLHEAKNQFHIKKLKAKKRAIISFSIGLAFLIAFIIILVITNNNEDFKVGLPLIIVFAVFAFIFLEAGIVFFVLMKCVYEYQEKNREKILAIINQEVNKNKKQSNE